MDPRTAPDPYASPPSRAVPTAPDARSNIRSQDLTSLPVLRALLRTRNVTTAGEAVGLSQPAASHALARLRRRFGDELLVRVGRDYTLTPLAQGLLERADQAFDALERLFENAFDPATSRREFTLALSDYSLIALSGPLGRILREEGPDVRVKFKQLSTVSDDVEELFRSSDGVIIPPDYIRGHPSMTLLHDRWVCVVGSAAAVADPLSTGDLARLPWVTSFGPSLFSASPPVRQLRALGIEPRIEMTVENFEAVPFLVAGTDRVAFIPEAMARRASNIPGVRLAPSPLPANDHVLSLFWNAIETNDPGHRWFRDVLRRAADGVAASVPD